MNRILLFSRSPRITRYKKQTRKFGGLPARAVSGGKSGGNAVHTNTPHHSEAYGKLPVPSLPCLHANFTYQRPPVAPPDLCCQGRQR